MAAALGATDTVDPADGDVVAQIQELTDDVGGFIPRGVDYAFEASANARGMEEAWHATRSAGHTILASMPWKLDDTISLPSVPAAIFGKTLHSSQWGHMNILRDLPRFIRLIEDGDVQVAPLISGHFALDELDAVLEQGRRARGLRRDHDAVTATRVDVHAHYLPADYRQALLDAGHEHPDGFPLLPEWSASRTWR